MLLKKTLEAALSTKHMPNFRISSNIRRNKKSKKIQAGQNRASYFKTVYEIDCSANSKIAHFIY